MSRSRCSGKELFEHPQDSRPTLQTMKFERQLVVVKTLVRIYTRLALYLCYAVRDREDFSHRSWLWDSIALVSSFFNVL